MALAETSIEYLPSISVVVPFEVPFSITFAPVTGPIASLTTPVTLRVCCVVPADTGEFSDVNTI